MWRLDSNRRFILLIVQRSGLQETKLEGHHKGVRCALPNEEDVDTLTHGKASVLSDGSIV